MLDFSFLIKFDCDFLWSARGEPINIGLIGQILVLESYWTGGFQRSEEEEPIRRDFPIVPLSPHCDQQKPLCSSFLPFVSQKYGKWCHTTPQVPHYVRRRQVWLRFEELLHETEHWQALLYIKMNLHFWYIERKICHTILNSLTYFLYLFLPHFVHVECRALSPSKFHFGQKKRAGQGWDDLYLGCNQPIHNPTGCESNAIRPICSGQQYMFWSTIVNNLSNVFHSICVDP